jgi:hypothetical protein
MNDIKFINPFSSVGVYNNTGVTNAPINVTTTATYKYDIIDEIKKVYLAYLNPSSTTKK